MILLDATVNGQGVTLLLDTWADNSILSPSVAGVSAKLDVLTSDPVLTRDGLFDGLDPVANQIADDIKRN